MTAYLIVDVDDLLQRLDSRGVTLDIHSAASALINVVTVIILVGLVLWFNRLTRATEGVRYA